MNLLECECDNYKKLFTDLCQFIEGFGVLHDTEGKVISFFRCGNSWFANEEEHDDECEECDRLKCDICNEFLEDEENMGACVCGDISVMCQQCGTWLENEDGDGDWYCPDHVLGGIESGTIQTRLLVEKIRDRLISSGKTFNNIEEILECTKHIDI